MNTDICILELQFLQDLCFRRSGIQYRFIFILINTVLQYMYPCACRYQCILLLCLRVPVCPAGM